MADVQQQAIEAKRQHILDSATRVFATKGFHPTTIRDIATEAAVADGTIYNYFENKTALLFGILNRMREVAIAQAEPEHLEQASLRDLLAALIRHPLVAFRDNDFALFRIILSEAMVNDTLRTKYQRDIIEPTLELAVTTLRSRSGTTSNTENLDLAVRVIAGMLTGLMVQMVMGDSLLESQWETLPERLADLLADALERQLL